jgi:hypothetical protein
MNTKIADFMPVVSVIPDETTPENYVEESTTAFNGDANWEDYPVEFIDKKYPEVKWQFPKMQFKNKFGEELESTDPWYFYGGYVNNYSSNLSKYNLNYFTNLGASGYLLYNRTVPSPQMFLLSPLFYALQSIGYKMKGDVQEDVFIQSLVMYSNKNNLCKVELLPEPTNIIFDGLFTFVSGIFSTPDTYRKIQQIVIVEPGNYHIEYNFDLKGPDLFGLPRRCSLLVNPTGSDNTEVLFSALLFSPSNIRSGSTDFFIDSPGVWNFLYYNDFSEMPHSYSLTLVKSESVIFHQMHPTINTGRYLPDWTLSTYINNLKNFLNLDIDIDDVTKTLPLNFNENWITIQKPEILKKSMSIVSYEQNPYNAFLLKYDNDENLALWITKDGPETYTNQISDFDQLLDSKFKFMPSNLVTTELTEALESIGGVGLMIYDPANMPFTSVDLNGQTLKLGGDGGIYDVYWKKFLKFRLNASVVEVSGGFTKTEIGKFLKTKRIHFDHQDYVVSVLGYKELKQDNYIVTFKLESVNF